MPRRVMLPSLLAALLVPLAVLAQAPAPPQPQPFPADVPARPSGLAQPTGTVRTNPDGGVPTANRILRLDEAVQTALQQQPQP